LITRTFLTIIIDILILGLGSYGAYVLVREFTELERLPSLGQCIQILRKRWQATLALLIAHLFFFSRLYLGLFK
jgi:hypothetical protein